MKRLATLELVVLTALSALTHFWHLYIPNAVVFDEAHYTRFAGHYLDGTYYFDLHPPLAKLLYAGVAKLFGVSAMTMLGTDPVVELRVLPALLGALTVPLVYVIMRQVGASRRVSAFAAFAVLCENALLVDSRFALIEPLMIPFGLGALALYLASRGKNGASRLVLLGIAAFAAGLAVSAKWTGASALGIVMATWVLERPRTRSIIGRTLAEGALLVVIPAVVYLTTFAVHFHLLPRSGVGDGMMSRRFRMAQIGSAQYDSTVSMPLMAKIGEVHDAMRRGNRSLELTVHPAASPWYTWPIMKHPIALWQDSISVEASSRHIILLGNPVIWWGGLITIGLAAIRYARRRGVPSRDRFAVALLTGGLLINFVPFIAIRRVMYLYHYLFALVFVIMLGTYCFGAYAGWNDDADESPWRFPSARSAGAFWAAAALIIVGFLYFLPFTYGWVLSPASYDAHFWVLHPRL